MPVSGRVSAGHSHFIATPSPLTRVSLARVYKYRLLNKISLSRIYKYNIIGRISLARTYLYKLRSKISLSRIYRYGINSRLSLSRSYRYAIVERIALSRIYNYLIIGRISLARIYKYKLSARVSLPRIYRYALQARISLARIYKYKIVGRILKPSIFRYNILNRLSLARIYKYRLLNKISLARIYRYKLFARISSDTIFKYNILVSISLSRIYRYAIKSRLSFNQTYRYAIISALFRASKSSIYRYAIKQRLTIQHVYQYNILQKVGNTNAIYFDGVNDYLALGSDTLWTQTKTKFSFSIWVKIPAFGTGTYQNIVNHSWQAVGSFIMYQNITGTSIVFAIRDSIQQRASTYNMPASLANTWINVVCTVDNSLAGGDVKIYVNGNVGNVSSDLTESLTLNAPLFIGSASTTLGGKTKDFRYWLNKALTQQEINDVVNNSANAPTPDYWLKMNEGTGNPIDSISGTKTATLTNGAYWSSGNALIFDGIDDSATIPNVAAINNLDDYTITFWIYPTVHNAPSTPNIITKLYPSNNGFIIYFGSGAGNWIVNFRTVGNTGIGVSVTHDYILTNGVNRWYFIGVTVVRSTGAMKLYIDGVLRAQGTNLDLGTNLSGTVANITINGASAPNKWAGNMRDFRLYRSAQDAAILDIYNELPTAPTPNYWLKMNEGKGSPLDTISGTNTATLVNGTSWSPDSPNVLLARASSYIYNILNKISKSRTYLYRILIPCLQTQTYRYKILNKISLSRLYRYNILQRIGDLKSIYFDGINDYLALGNDASLWSQALTKFSFSFWVYQDVIATSPADDAFINHASLGTFPNGRFICSNEFAGHLSFFIKNSAGVNIAARFSNSAIAGVWRFIVCTYDNSLGSANIKIYVDGQIGNVTGNLTEVVNLSAPLQIGDNSQPLQGKIKDFRWWTTKALIQTEIDAIRNNSPNAPVPDYWLKMSEGTGNTVDTISGTKTATLTNGASWSSTAPDIWLGKKQYYIYNIFQRVASKTNTYIYKIINFARVALARKYRYNILNAVLKQSTYRYRILGRLSKPRIYRYAIISRMSLSRVYRYSIKQRFSKFSKYVYKILERVTLERRYRYSILIEEPVSWSVAGKLTDFPARVDSLVIDFIAGKWAESTLPMSGTIITTRPNQNQSENVNIGSYDYDKFRTYYIRVKQQPAQIVNKVRENLMEFNQIIEMKISVRRLSRGEAFKELQKIINELIRMWITFQSQDIWGIQAISFDSITPLQNKETITMHQSNKTVWEKTLKVILHYHKVKFKRGSDF